MRIVIDLQGAQNGSRYRGIGRYSVAFALALVRSRGRHQVVILLSNLFPDSINELRPVFEQELGPGGVRVWSGIAPCSYFNQRNTWRRRTSELLREAFIESLAPDIVLVSSMIEGGIDNAVTSIGEFSHGIHTAAILYDLIPLLYKKEYLPDARARKWHLEKIEQLRKADLCLAISQSSCDEAVAHIGLPVIEAVAATIPLFSPKSPPMLPCSSTPAFRPRSRGPWFRCYRTKPCASNSSKPGCNAQLSSRIRTACPGSIGNSFNLSFRLTYTRLDRGKAKYRYRNPQKRFNIPN